MNTILGTATNLAIRTFLRQKKVEGALAQYIDDYATATGRTALEWQLAESIASGKSAVRAPSSWPDSMIARPSGAALAFIVAQRSRTDCAPPIALFGPQVMPAGMRRLLACAWAEHPACAALCDASDRRAIVRQLIADESAIEPLLDAVLHLDDPELATDVAEQWLRHPLAVQRASIEIFQIMVRRESLAAVCREAVGMRIAAARCNGNELVQLSELLASLHDHRAVVAVSDVGRGGDLAPASRQRLLALRLGALGVLDADEQLVDEYRREWIPGGAVHPAPEQLLYTLHVSGADDAIEHLLASPPEKSPRWIHLWRRRVVTKRVASADIAEWMSLCRDDSKDGSPLLIGLTEAILAASNSTRSQEREAVASVRHIWSQLADHEDQGVVARAYLVLLEGVDGDIVSTYQRHFAGVSLSTHTARRAAVAYVRALSRMRAWKELYPFLDTVPAGHLRLAFGAHELETHTLMSALGGDQDMSIDEWLGAWERLLALPLDTGAISDVLRHFVSLTASLRQTASRALTGEHFEDVYLQVLRRGCAEAERLLAAGSLSPDQIAAIRARLATADIPAARGVIDELRLRVT